MEKIFTLLWRFQCRTCRMSHILAMMEAGYMMQRIKAANTQYRVIRTDIHNYHFVEEDTFDLG